MSGGAPSLGGVRAASHRGGPRRRPPAHGDSLAWQAARRRKRCNSSAAPGPPAREAFARSLGNCVYPDGNPKRHPGGAARRSRRVAHQGGAEPGDVTAHHGQRAVVGLGCVVDVRTLSRRPAGSAGRGLRSRSFFRASGTQSPAAMNVGTGSGRESRAVQHAILGEREHDDTWAPGGGGACRNSETHAEERAREAS